MKERVGVWRVWWERDNSFQRKERVRRATRGEEGKIRLVAYPSYWERIK